MSRSSFDTFRAALVACAAAAVLGCSRSPITASRIEAAIAPTFANLVHLQVSSLGLPAMAASEFGVKASCRKLVARSHVGSGDWTCILIWQGPDRRILRDTYDLFVGTEGCYMATVAGESLGGPILKAENGTDVRNLLYNFEGCFDTT